METLARVHRAGKRDGRGSARLPLGCVVSALSRDRAVGAFGFAHWESSAGLWRGPLVVLRKELYAGSGFGCASGYSSDREAEPEMERSD